MNSALLVMFGGAIGALGRYETGRLMGRLFGNSWPWGTLAGNIIGGLVMGLFVGWMASRAQGSEGIRLFFAVGVLGGFTTFSSFSLEMMLMIQRGEVLSAISYAAVSVVIAVGALALGLGLMRGVTA